jgi:hypothetical protein
MRPTGRGLRRPDVEPSVSGKTSKFEILLAVMIPIVVIWVVTPCSLAGVCQCC